MNRLLRVLLVISTALAVQVLAATPASAQTVTSGSISGVIKDAQGGVLPGATVTVTSLETGLTREATTEMDGTYAVNFLPPGRYRVDAELSGLGKAGAPTIEVLLGNSTRADITISPQVAESITVTAAAPVVDTTRAATADSVTSDQIENLPILGRDFKSLASMTPGINSAFGGRITGAGARGIATDFNIDGATSNNDFFGENTGGTRAPFSFSQAAIKEFQVIRLQYDAEYGRGVGAQLNAITKSGTNEFHGEAFVFRRNKGWVGSRPTTLSNGQTVVDSFNPLDSTQPGFVLGGPIVRDKAFFLANFDGQRQKQPTAVTDLRQRNEFQLLSPTLQQQFLAKVASFVGHPYEEELSYDTTFNQNTYLGKVDLNVGTRNRISVRDNYTNFENANNQSLNNLSNQGVENDRFNQLVGQGTTILGDSLINDALVEVVTDERPIEPQSSTRQEVKITGFSPIQTFGQLDSLPNNTKERKVQVKDTLHYVRGSHELKAGTDLVFMHIDNFFLRNLSGVFSYNTAQDYVDNIPASFNQGFGAGGHVIWNQNTYALYAMDSFRANPRLTVDYGVRYDWQSMPLPPGNAFPQHPEFITNIKEDKNNVAPRLGVAYDIVGNGRSVLRGGIGKFYGYMPDILLSNPLTQISGIFSQVTITSCASPGAVPCPAFPNILSGDQVAQLARLSTDIVTVSPDYEAQEAWRGSLQFEKQIGTHYSAAIGAIFSKLSKVEGSRNINAVPIGISLGNVPLYNIAAPNRRYPDLGVVRELCSCEEASFRSLSLEAHRLATSGSRLSLDVSYTWSRSIDEETNERSTSSSFLFDPFNPLLSRGPSDNDVRHRLGGGVLYRLPYGFLVAGLFTWRSGVPYTGGTAYTQSGASSLTRLSQTTNNIPIFVDSNGNPIDLALANNFTTQQFADFLSAQGAHIIGRNTYRQPNAKYVDFRVSKTFDFVHGMRAEILLEVFNLFNNKVELVTGNNLNLVRATYTPATDKYAFTSFASTYGLTNSYASPTTSSTGPDPRQLQIAAKFRF